MSPATDRERVWMAVRHQQPDRTPYQITCTVPARLKLEEYYQTTDLDAFLGNSMVK